MCLLRFSALAGASSANGDPHKTLARDRWANYVFAFHDNDEIGPKMLARIAKHTGLSPGDL